MSTLDEIEKDDFQRGDPNEDESEECEEGEGEEEEESEKSSESDLEEDPAKTAEIKRVQIIMTEPREMQDPVEPAVSQDTNKERLKELTQRAPRDKKFFQSMEIAERGYITRLRPESDDIVRPTTSQYQIRPALEDKFKSTLVKTMINGVLNDELGGKTYSEDAAKKWTHGIANTIRKKVKDMGFTRYKFIIQCVIGEERGAGVKIGSRCLWDADTDNYASETFFNESIFCMAAVYAVYLY